MSHHEPPEIGTRQRWLTEKTTTKKRPKLRRRKWRISKRKDKKEKQINPVEPTMELIFGRIVQTIQRTEAADAGASTATLEEEEPSATTTTSMEEASLEEASPEEDSLAEAFKVEASVEEEDHHKNNII